MPICSSETRTSHIVTNGRRLPSGRREATWTSSACWRVQRMPWPRQAIQAIFARDYLVVQAVTLVLALGVVATNFLVDVLTAVLDPRVST